MKTPNFIVRIPEPCHEDWNKMEPDAKGKFCNSCSKSVFDFSTKTDTEIKDILMEYKDQKVCGHFKKSQINRPLNISINIKDLPKNISITKAFGIALFLVFGTFLFSCTDNYGNKVGEIEVVAPPQYTIGMMSIDIPPPPIDSISKTCSVISGDTIITINEEHIDGGISFEESTYEEPIPVVKDSVIFEEPMIVGMMVMPYTERQENLIETTQYDTTVTNNSRKIGEDNNISKTSNFSIYPNPSNGEFTIKYDILKRTNVRVDLYDLKGILIRTIVDVNNQYEGKYQIPVNLDEFPNGIYLVNLINGDKKITERLVIER